MEEFISHEKGGGREAGLRQEDARLREALSGHFEDDPKFQRMCAQASAYLDEAARPHDEGVDRARSLGAAVRLL